jgi:Fe-S-cluster containining protein
VKDNKKLIRKVAELYDWLDAQIRSYGDIDNNCAACGRCCDFESFDHKLFVTTPEIMYLAGKLGTVKPMPGAKCPYNNDGKCTIYEHRFSGCRIFYCRKDKDYQSELSESALKKLKSICSEFEIPYRYNDLATALNGLAG